MYLFLSEGKNFVYLRGLRIDVQIFFEKNWPLTFKEGKCLMGDTHRSPISLL
jgi:hypothetical protein